LKGSYILIIELKDDADIQIGALGKIHFKKGTYCYVGSARGPGGIEKRVERHLRKEKRKRWHIDYLLEHASISEVFRKEGGDEVATAREISSICSGIKGFGASDSPLDSHLFFCNELFSLFSLLNSLGYSPL
jgi:Uri superfamily endonuclease